MNGESGKALILLAWGGLAIGLVDNFLQPIPGQGPHAPALFVPVFLSMLGGARQPFRRLGRGCSVPVLLTVGRWRSSTSARRVRAGAETL
jgi:hypothetical protein